MGLVGMLEGVTRFAGRTLAFGIAGNKRGTPAPAAAAGRRDLT